MPKLLTKNAKISNANDFRQSLLRVSPAPDVLYLFFGREAAWTDEANPPNPLDSVSDEFYTRNNIIGIKKLLATNTCLLIQRHNWTTNTVFAQYSATDATLLSKNFYVLTADNNVYKCLSNNAGAVSIIQPTGISTATTQTSDGYVWKFMYSLPSSLSDAFLTSQWLPVPSGTQKSAAQISVESTADYTSGSPPGGHGSDAAMELGANYIMLQQILNGSEGGVFPLDNYRQFGIWKNPKLISTGEVATGNLYDALDVDSDVDLTSGTILYVENKTVITRADDQTENIKIIFQF